MALCKTKKRLPEGGGKPRIGKLDEHFISVFDSMRAQYLRVTCRVIQSKAHELDASYTASEASGPGSSKPYVASRGWLRIFLKR